jgi:two-component system, cell cycle response regulator
MKILVVDDDPVMRLTIERLLTSRGCEVVCAVDGAQAYVLLQGPDAPKLAIVDWMMPGLSGPELCRKLRASSAAGRIHIIMVTANRANTDVVTGLEAGADDYMMKPFNADELYARVRAAERLISAQEQLRLQATRDELTGILNRAGILDVLGRALARAARERSPLSVVLADIDRFKNINDSYGHPVGDGALRGVAKLLKSALRPHDAVGRYGGEEFLVVLPACGLEDAFGAAERMRAQVFGQPVLTAAGSLAITVSLGVASTGDRQTEAEQLILAADHALYAAKASGRNRVEGRTS